MASKREDRFPRLRTSGPGYETTGRDRFDNKITIEFNYEDLDVKARDVRKAVSEFSEFIYNMDKKYGIKKSNKEGFDISMKVAKSAGSGQRRGSRTSRQFPLLPDGLRIQQAIKPAMGQMGEDGKRIMTEYVTRVDTGRMRNSIRYNARSRGNKYVVNIGWTELWMKYFGFQENGFFIGGATKTGPSKKVNGMYSVLRTYMQMLPRIQNYASRLQREYTRGDGDFLKGKGPSY